MSIRYDDRERTLTLSVRDLIEEGAPSGHLTVEVVQSRTARMAAGRRVHLDYQAEQGEIDSTYQAEVRVKHQVPVGAWTAILQGRVDGLADEDGRPVVEEIKSTALDAARLFDTRLDDFPRYVAQLEVYLWMLAEGGWDRPVGRLVLVSLADGSRHVLGVALDRERVKGFIWQRLEELVEARERRIEWMEERRGQTLPLPHEVWRAGQREMAEATAWGLEAGHHVLIEAPTGIGKTAAVLHGVLAYALAHDKQVFWATSRTTQQAGVNKTLQRFADAGLKLRAVSINAKEKVCLNEVVSCRPDACAHAESYYDKLRAHRPVQALTGRGVVTRDVIEGEARRCQICPYELAVDLSEHVDVVVGDYNYAFEPSVHLRRHFGDTAGDWIVVVDEAHQLVERARGWGSPAIEAALAREAADVLYQADPDRYAPFIRLAREIAETVLAEGTEIIGPSRDGESVVQPSADAFSALAERLDEVGLEYALLKAECPAVAEGQPDPWMDLARQVLRFRAAWELAGEETVCLARTARGRERLSLLCLDPSSWLGPRIERLAGFVGLSATLSPTDFYRDLLGLPSGRLDIVRVDSPFPRENRKILIAPRISTTFKDRAAHAPATAKLISDCCRSIKGNVAVYFPSFAMLQDISARWDLPDREVLLQEPGMPDARRQEWLDRLVASDRPVVLAAALGGIFAEGIDLPPGALSAVLLVGPALPPVGLERDLLRSYYEQRYGEGFRYASLIPGMTKVAQAGGRLIRRPTDRGVVVLLGRRFRWRDYQALFPRDWDPEVPDDPVAAIVAFEAS